MKDRVPLYPGRVTLTPVSGQANTYDMVRADQPTEEGTPLNKETLLSDTTAEALGLSGDPTVDDAFGALENSVQLTYTVVPDKEFAKNFWIDSDYASCPNESSYQSGAGVVSGEWYIFNEDSYIYQTKDLKNGPWEIVPTGLPTSSTYRYVLVGRDNYVAIFYCGSNGTGGYRYYPDTKTTSAISELSHIRVYNYESANRLEDDTLIINTSAGNLYYLSPGSTTWVQSSTSVSNMSGLQGAYKNGTYMLVNAYSIYIGSSLDNLTQYTTTIGSYSPTNTFAFGNYFVVTSNEKYWYSTDGISWTTGTYEENTDAHYYKFGSYMVSINTNEGIYAVTSNLTTWETISGPTTRNSNKLITYCDEANEIGYAIVNTNSPPMITTNTTKKDYSVHTPIADNCEDGIIQALGAARIETGFYIGTDTAGEDEKSTLTFSFCPKVVIIVQSNANTGGFPWIYGATRGYSYLNPNNAYYAYITWFENSITWYSNNASLGQLNELDKVYYYIAIG